MKWVGRTYVKKFEGQVARNGEPRNSCVVCLRERSAE